jgi:curved DNA-binding protein CbpA
MDREAALNALDVAPDADAGTIRRAYRDRVKAVHPDADGGDEDEFRRVRAAYERLTDPERGKG